MKKIGGNLSVGNNPWDSIMADVGRLSRINPIFMIFAHYHGLIAEPPPQKHAPSLAQVDGFWREGSTGGWSLSGRSRLPEAGLWSLCLLPAGSVLFFRLHACYCGEADTVSSCCPELCHAFPAVISKSPEHPAQTDLSSEKLLVLGTLSHPWEK